MQTEFKGFEPPNTNRWVAVPPSFLGLIRQEKASITKIVSYVLDQTLAGQAEVEVSHAELARTLAISRSAVQDGISGAIAAGYIACTRQGVNATSRSRYVLCWAENKISTPGTGSSGNGGNTKTEDEEKAETDVRTAEKQFATSHQTENPASSQPENPAAPPLESINSKSLINTNNLETLESNTPAARKTDRQVAPPALMSTSTAEPVAVNHTLPVAFSPYLAQLTGDFSLALGDTAHASSNRTQVLRLWEGSRLDEKSFANFMYTARERTLRYAVLRPGEVPPPIGQVRNRMAYFFTVLRNLLAGDHAPTRSAGYAVADHALTPKPTNCQNYPIADQLAPKPKANPYATNPRPRNVPASWLRYATPASYE